MDSSDKRDKRELLVKGAGEFKKLKVFHTVALGLVEPLRMYGISKCSFEWILYLDTDERLSEGLSKGIRRLVAASDCDAYAIKRYEEVSNGKATQFFTWNIRLYKKDAVAYKGILHEQPMIKGRLKKLLEGDSYIEHVTELKSSSAGEEYFKIMKFSRLSYAAYNEKMVDYLSKVVMPQNRSFENTLVGKAFKGLLRAYERITLRRPEDELSAFDYFSYYFILEAVYALKKRSVSNFLSLLPRSLSFSSQVGRWKREPDGKEGFEISKEINKTGLIKFLSLDDEKTIKALNSKYSGGKQGIELTLKLLKDQYEKNKRSNQNGK